MYKVFIVFVKEQRIDDYRYLYYYEYLRYILRKLRNKFSLKQYAKNNYDSPLIGFNSFNVNSRHNYSTLNNNKHVSGELKIDP